MPEINIRRIRVLLGYNRDYIKAIDHHYRYKAGRYWGLLYRELSADRRERTVELLKLMTPEERLRWLRINTWRLERLHPRAFPYARALLAEYEARARIAELELYVPRALKPEDLLAQAIDLKTRELAFLNELADSLKAVAWEHPEWEAEVRGYATRVEGWLSELRAIVPPPPPPPPPPVLSRVLQSRMFYRSYKAKLTPQPFAFLVAFVKTREPEKYPEEFMKSAITFLTEDPKAFPTLGMAITSVGAVWLKRGKFTEHSAGAYYVDGREVRPVDWDEVIEEAKKFGLTPEELIEQIRYYAAFYRIRFGVATIYREYLGKMQMREGRWVIIPDWGKTRVEPEETLIPEAPHPEDLEV